MSQLDRFFSSNVASEIGNGESVFVTHVESPVLFYCRLSTDGESFSELQGLIAKHALTGPTLPKLNPDKNQNDFILVYSIIRNSWCRGRLLTYQVDKALKPINAKVCLIDFGSIEVVLWNVNYVLLSTLEIDNFNNGRGFCFACSLGKIKPFNGPTYKPFALNEWSSYANFLIEKETKNRELLLKTIANDNNNSNNNILLCDLIPIVETNLSYENGNSQNVFKSLANYLVNANVARFINQEQNNRFTVYEDEKENFFVS